MSTALVFAGGGSNAGFGVGVEQILRERGGYSWGAVYGVSAGALNSILIGQGRPHMLQHLWLEEIEGAVKKRRIWSYGWGLLTGTKGIRDNSKLRRIVRELVEEAPFVIPTRIGYVDMNSGRYRKADASHADFVDLVIASTTIPLIFDLQYVGGSQLGDGGLRNVTPLADAIDQGHDEVVVILNRPPTLRPSAGLKGIVDVFGRTMDILTHEIAINDIKLCTMVNRLVEEAGGAFGKYRYVNLKVIRPSRDLGNSLDFSQEHAREAILQGQLDGRLFLEGS